MYFFHLVDEDFELGELYNYNYMQYASLDIHSSIAHYIMILHGYSQQFVSVHTHFYQLYILHVISHLYSTQYLLNTESPCYILCTIIQVNCCGCS